jgi:hypothetical protein
MKSMKWCGNHDGKLRIKIKNGSLPMKIFPGMDKEYSGKYNN